MKKPHIEVFKKLARVTGGDMKEIALRLDKTSQELEEWIRKDPAFEEAVIEGQEEFLDLCETSMFELIRGVPKMRIVEDASGQSKEIVDGYHVPPSTEMIIFFLKTRGKHRGYTESN